MNARLIEQNEGELIGETREKVRVLQIVKNSLLAYALHILAVSAESFLSIPGTEVAVLWIPSGTALGMALTRGYSAIPGVALGVITMNLWHGNPLEFALLRAAGTTAETAVGRYLITSALGPVVDLQRAKHVILFAAIATIGPILSALIGCEIQLPNIYPRYDTLMDRRVSWWLENYIAILTVTPAMLLWSRDPHWPYGKKKTLEALLLIGALLFISSSIFGVLTPSLNQHYPLEYLCLPFLIATIFRFDPKITALAILLLPVFCIHGTSLSRGPFFQREAWITVLLLQAFLGTTALQALILSAVVGERAIAKKRLAQSNQELERYGYLVSHDLQEPLRTVSNFTGLMKRKCMAQGNGEELADYFRLVENSTVRMQTMIQAFLDYSRIDSGFTHTPISCEAALKKALANLHASIQEAGAQIRYGELPTIEGDEDLLALVFQNLIANALKFRGSEPPQIEISAEKKDSRWIFKVKNNGIGIRPEDHQKIFTLFARAEHGLSLRPGAGIGLAICKRVVEAHRGSIWVASAGLGKGSEFFFSLPERQSPS